MTEQPAGPLPPSRLPDSYRDGRAVFCSAVEGLGGTVTSHDHPERGVDGEDLAVDVAAFGPEDAGDAVLIVSGTHGVEGFLGSALQTWWLTNFADERPADQRWVFLHALNPYGFSWVRRTNENNVDLNRNFIDWDAPIPHSADYDTIADLLVPEHYDDATQAETTGALLELAGEHGLRWLQDAISSGQYRHPSGVFYGGTGPEWSHTTLAGIVHEHFASVDRLAVIDLHTGLGESGDAALLMSAHRGDADVLRAQEWWGEVEPMFDDDGVSSVLDGDWLQALPRWIPDVEITAMAIEYGTEDVITVLQALRHDAWLHHHGDPTGPDAAGVREAVFNAFASRDDEWIRRTHDTFLRCTRQVFGNAGM